MLGPGAGQGGWSRPPPGPACMTEAAHCVSRIMSRLLRAVTSRHKSQLTSSRPGCQHSTDAGPGRGAQQQRTTAQQQLSTTAQQRLWHISSDATAHWPGDLHSPGSRTVTLLAISTPQLSQLCSELSIYFQTQNNNPQPADQKSTSTGLGSLLLPSLQSATCSSSFVFLIIVTLYYNTLH